MMRSPNQRASRLVWFSRKVLIRFQVQLSVQQGRGLEGRKTTWAVTRKLFSGLFIRYVGFGGGQVLTKRIRTKASMYDFIYLLIPCTQHSACLFGKEVTLSESLNLCISFSIIILTSEFASKINEIMYKKTSFES